jgi:hypothetical protein
MVQAAEHLRLKHRGLSTENPKKKEEEEEEEEEERRRRRRKKY